MLSREEYLTAWARWHGGTDPAASALVRGWLSTAYALARPLAGVPPLLATALGLLVAVGGAALAVPGGGWLVGAGLLVGLSGLLDSLDGALAIATGRASRRGFVLDSAVDRLTEAAYAAGLWAAGAPGWLAAAFGALCWLPDYLRARAGQAGVAETGAISVFERPTRVALTGFTLGGAGILALAGAGPHAGTVVTVGTAVGVLLGAVAVGQLGLSLRRALGDRPAHRDPGP
ncbi:CDP-alcohol phosphatidyltransferase family protein [Geodermatophilus sp. SYSU D00691]